MSLEETICGGRTHREKQASMFLIELHLSLLLQGFKQVWQKWDQAFGANPVERFPSQHQCLFHLWPIAPVEGYRRREDLLNMIEQP